MEKVIIFGIGHVSEFVVNNIINYANIVAIVDNSKQKQGEYCNGIKVDSPNIIRDIEYDTILICTTDYYEEISKQLVKELGVQENKIKKFSYYSALNLINYYQNYPMLITNEMKKYLEYISKNQALNVFNSYFEEEQNIPDVILQFDDSKRMFFALYKGKRMYLKRKYDTEFKARKYCQSLLVEQHEESPHKYEDNDFEVEKQSVVLDAGAAEGIFGLDVIERVRHLYLIESDWEWIEALRYTFELYSDKVTIINKFLSDKDTEDTTTIDNITKSDHIDFIKMDIEGAEVLALGGGKGYLKNNSGIKVAVCAYHNFEDEKEITQILNNYGFGTSTTKGYMCFPWTKAEPKRFVRGIVRGIK